LRERLTFTTLNGQKRTILEKFLGKEIEGMKKESFRKTRTRRGKNKLQPMDMIAIMILKTTTTKILFEPQTLFNNKNTYLHGFV
jgi:hypothetical protein